MSVTRMTLPPRWSGGVRRMMPSGTGSAVPLFDAGAESVVHRPAGTGAPGATAAVGSSVSETMHERPALFTPVTIRRTFPGILPTLRSSSGDLDVEQRRVLLRAEEIAFAHAAARPQPADRELDRVGRLEHHEVGHAALVDAEQARDRAAVERATVAHALEVPAVAADDVERDVVDARILAADGRGQLHELHGRATGAPTPMVSNRVRKSSRESVTSTTWFIVHS